MTRNSVVASGLAGLFLFAGCEDRGTVSQTANKQGVITRNITTSDGVTYEANGDYQGFNVTIWKYDRGKLGRGRSIRVVDGNYSVSAACSEGEIFRVPQDSRDRVFPQGHIFGTWQGEDFDRAYSSVYESAKNPKDK